MTKYITFHFTCHFQKLECKDVSAKDLFYYRNTSTLLKTSFLNAEPGIIPGTTPPIPVLIYNYPCTVI